MWFLSYMVENGAKTLLGHSSLGLVKWDPSQTTAPEILFRIGLNIPSQVQIEDFRQPSAKRQFFHKSWPISHSEREKLLLAINKDRRKSINSSQHFIPENKATGSTPGGPTLNFFTHNCKDYVESLLTRTGLPIDAIQNKGISIPLFYATLEELYFQERNVKDILNVVEKPTNNKLLTNKGIVYCYPDEKGSYNYCLSDELTHEIIDNPITKKSIIQLLDAKKHFTLEERKKIFQEIGHFSEIIKSDFFISERENYNAFNNVAELEQIRDMQKHSAINKLKCLCQGYLKTLNGSDSLTIEKRKLLSSLNKKLSVDDLNGFYKKIKEGNDTNKILEKNRANIFSLTVQFLFHVLSLGVIKKLTKGTFKFWKTNGDLFKHAAQKAYENYDNQCKLINQRLHVLKHQREEEQQKIYTHNHATLFVQKYSPENKMTKLEKATSNTIKAA